MWNITYIMSAILIKHHFVKLCNWTHPLTHCLMLPQNICSVIDAQPKAIVIQCIVPLPRQCVISTLKPRDPFAVIVGSYIREGTYCIQNKIDYKWTCFHLKVLYWNYTSLKAYSDALFI